MHFRSWSLAGTLAVAALLFSGCASPIGPRQTAEAGDPKLVIVTFDGLRWQEIFRGADEKLAHDPRFVGEDWLEDWVDKPYLKPMDRPVRCQQPSDRLRSFTNGGILDHRSP